MNKKLILGMIVMLMLVSFASADLNTDLVSYWSFDVDTTDDVGSTDLTNNGAVQVSGKLGNAYDFERTDVDYMSSSVNILNGTSEYTICYWVTRESSGNTMRVWDNGLVYGGYTSVNDGIFLSRNSTTSVASNTDSAISAHSSYFYYCGVYDGAQITLYLNNTAVADVESLTGLTSATQNFYLGQDPTGGENYDGIIDEVGIWQRALTSTELTALFNSGTGCNPTDNYACGTKFDEYYITNQISRYYLNDTAYDGATDVKDSWLTNDGQGFGKTFYNGTVTGATLVRNLTGTITGATWDTDSVRGNVLSFDGDNDYVEINGVTEPLSKSLTASIWIYPESYTNVHRILEKGGNSDFVLLWTTTGYINGIFYGLSTSTVTIPNTAITLNEWNHIIFTYDGSNVIGYVNGEVEVNVSSTGNIADTSDKITIGNYGGTKTYGFDGNISNLHLYDKALNSTEVLDLYNNERFPLSAENENNFIDGYYTDFHFPLNEGTGTSVATTESKWDGKYEFDGNDQIISTASPNLILNDEITITAWTKITSLGGSQVISYLVGDGSERNAQFSYSGNNLQFLFRNSANTAWRVYTQDITAFENQWVHVAVKHKFGTANNFAFYINGIEYTQTVSTDLPLNGTTNEFIIGSIEAGEYFTGDIDEVKLYNRALSESEIQAEMESNALYDSEDIVAYYDFNGDADDRNFKSVGHDSTNYLSKGMNFDGVGDYINVGDFMDDMAVGSVSLWTKFQKTSYQELITKNDNFQVGTTVFSGDDLFIRLRNSAGTWENTIYYNFFASYPIDNWYNIVAVWNSTGGTQIYIDGTVVQTGTHTEGIKYATSGDVYIGSRIGADGFTEGDIQEVRIYDKALSQDEVLTLYNGLKDINLSAYDTFTSDPINSWNYNFTAIDVTGSTTDNNGFAQVPYGDYNLAWSDSTDRFDKNFTVNVNTSESSVSLLDIYDTVFDINSLDWYNNTPYTTFNATLQRGSNSVLYTGLTNSDNLNLISGNYNITFSHALATSRTYVNEAIASISDSLEGVLYNLVKPTFYLNVYDYLGTTLLTNIVTTNNITASTTSNPWSTTAEDKINESQPEKSFAFEISDLSYDHKDYSNTITFNRTMLSQNVNLSPNQVVLTFSESIEGHITFFNSSNEPNNARFNDTSLLIISQSLYDSSDLKIKFNSLNDNGTIYNGTQYYETIVDHDVHITDTITILPQADWYFYFKVFDPSGSELKDVIIRASFVVPNNGSTVTDPDAFNLFGQRITENDGGTFFFTDSQAQINFVVSKEGFETQSLTFPIGDYSYDESNPYTVTMQYSDSDDDWNAQISASPVIGSVDATGSFVIDTNTNSEGYRKVIYEDDTHIVGNIFAPNRDLVQIKTDYRNELITLSANQYDVYKFILVNGTDFLWVNGTNLDVEVYLDGELFKTLEYTYGVVDETSLFASGDLANIPRPVIFIGMLLFAIACAIIFKTATAGYIGWTVGSALAFAIQPIFGWIFIPTLIIIIASWYKGVTED